MKLFYSPGACSLSPHIVMAELNMAYEIEAVDMKNKTCASGDFKSINIKGAVPAIKLDSGDVLTEGAIIAQYLADQKADQTLLGKFGTMERTRTLEWMNYIATEVHRSFSPLFGADKTFSNTTTASDVKDFAKKTLNDKLNFITEKLGNNDYLSGNTFTIADAYMFTCLSWSKHVGLDLSSYANINNYLKRISERPAVIRAMKEEGLIK